MQSLRAFHVNHDTYKLSRDVTMQRLSEELVIMYYSLGQVYDSLKLLVA